MLILQIILSHSKNILFCHLRLLFKSKFLLCNNDSLRSVISHSKFSNTPIYFCICIWITFLLLYQNMSKSTLENGWFINHTCPGCPSWRRCHGRSSRRQMLTCVCCQNLEKDKYIFSAHFPSFSLKPYPT